MPYDTLDPESLAQRLREEREQLVLAWEELEREQRTLASIAADPTHSLEHNVRLSKAPSAGGQPPRKTNPARGPLASEAEPKVDAKSLASNTFKFLQREFDNRK